MIPAHITPINSPIHRVDPRVRFLGGLMLALVLALSSTPIVLLCGLALGIILCLLARLPWIALRPRLFTIATFAVLLLAFLPLEIEPHSTLRLTYHPERVALAATLILKAFSIVLVFTALVSTIEPVTLGHALRHLGCPASIILMLLFTIRYAETLTAEARRMQAAMALRGFRPRLHPRSLLHFGTLAGMLIARSIDRSERIMDAMTCRGFNGTFHLYRHFAFTTRDLVATFLLATAAILLLTLHLLA